MNVRKSCPAAMTGLFLAVGLLALAGCATGNAGKKPVAPEVVAAKPPAPAGPSVTRLENGREGFVIREPSSLDAETRRDFEQAVTLINDGNYQKGIDLLEKVIAREPGITAPHINVAIAYRHLDKPEQAEQHLKAALALVPGHPAASNEYGLLLRKAGRFDDARSVFEKSLSVFPEYHPIERNLGILCDLYLKDTVCAVKHYEAYGKAMPQDKQVKVWLTDLQTRSAQYAMQTGAGRPAN